MLASIFQPSSKEWLSITKVVTKKVSQFNYRHVNASRWGDMNTMLCLQHMPFNSLLSSKPLSTLHNEKKDFIVTFLNSWCRSPLRGEVMKMEGYDVMLEYAFEHLMYDEKVGRISLANNAKRQKIWLDNFFNYDGE